MHNYDDASSTDEENDFEEPIWGSGQDPKNYDPDEPNTHPLNCTCLFCLPGN